MAPIWSTVSTESEEALASEDAAEASIEEEDSQAGAEEAEIAKEASKEAMAESQLHVVIVNPSPVHSVSKSTLHTSRPSV